MQWQRSKSCSGGQCVEVARDGDEYLVRDSKRPDAEPLRLTAGQWSAFLELAARV